MTSTLSSTPATTTTIFESSSSSLSSSAASPPYSWASAYAGPSGDDDPAPLPEIPLIDTFFDTATATLILVFLFLSLISLTAILHLRIKSQFSPKLQSFSSHWTARFLMILLISLWSINEVLRLPIFRKSHVFTSFPPLSFPQQTQLCKLHFILSFGLYEPGFLVSLLFLVDISISKRRPSNWWALGYVAITCLPLVVVLYFAVYILPGSFFNLPQIFYRSSSLLEDHRFGGKIVYCTYPLVGGVVFAAFGVSYAIVFLFSCWKVVSLAINKRLRARINTLALTILVCLSLQIVMLMVSVIWNPKDLWYYALDLFNFVCVLICGVVGEGVLIIKPTVDALHVGSYSRVTVEEMELEEESSQSTTA